MGGMWGNGNTSLSLVVIRLVTSVRGENNSPPLSKDRLGFVRQCLGGGRSTLGGGSHDDIGNMCVAWSRGTGARRCRRCRARGRTSRRPSRDGRGCWDGCHLSVDHVISVGKNGRRNGGVVPRLSSVQSFLKSLVRLVHLASGLLDVREFGCQDRTQIRRLAGTPSDLASLCLA